LNDLELLKKYEPVLRFAKSERFFPMPVEPYLEMCHLFPSGPLGIAEAITHIRMSLVGKIGELKSEQFFLRFVNKPLNDADAWVWWGILSVIGLATGWFTLNMAGIEIAVLGSLVAALIIFMLASPIRLRIIPAVLVALISAALCVAPIWFFIRPSEFISVQLEYFVLFPIYLIILFYASLRLMKFILERIIPEGPGLIMDMLSQATEKIAREAYFQYARILEKEPNPVYYGRILHEIDANGDQWTILQYHFFYAFNDWRLAANGMNHHEGDWEMVAVYLKNEVPYSLLLSQHGAGNMEWWDNALKAVDEEENLTTHPIVYTALGSHANYSRPEVIRSPTMYSTGRLQRILFWIDGAIHYLFLLFNPNQKARQIALKEMQEKQMNLLAEDAFVLMKDEMDHYVVSLPMEIAAGDGFRIGFQGNLQREGSIKSSSYIKRIMSSRPTRHPREAEWKRVLLNYEPGWVQYKGLWGVKSLLSDESGPPGPKWDRPKKDQVGVKERIRWDKPLDWLAELEKNKH